VEQLRAKLQKVHLDDNKLKYKPLYLLYSFTFLLFHTCDDKYCFENIQISQQYSWCLWRDSFIELLLQLDLDRLIYV
jgi:hypothetical protein